MSKVPTLMLGRLYVTLVAGCVSGMVTFGLLVMLTIREWTIQDVVVAVIALIVASIVIVSWWHHRLEGLQVSNEAQDDTDKENTNIMPTVKELMAELTLLWLRENEDSLGAHFVVTVNEISCYGELKVQRTDEGKWSVSLYYQGKDVTIGDGFASTHEAQIDGERQLREACPDLETV